MQGDIVCDNARLHFVIQEGAWVDVWNMVMDVPHVTLGGYQAVSTSGLDGFLHMFGNSFGQKRGSLVVS